MYLAQIETNGQCQNPTDRLLILDELCFSFSVGRGPASRLDSVVNLQHTIRAFFVLSNRCEGVLSKSLTFLYRVSTLSRTTLKR